MLRKIGGNDQKIDIYEWVLFNYLYDKKCNMNNNNLK